MRTSDNSDTPWQILSPVLLGRTREIDTLSRALLGAAGGSGQCFILAGEAGVGKTRLLTEIQQHALADHFLVLQGNCFEQDVSFPYAVIADMLRTFFTAREATAIRETLGPLAAELIKLLPELAWILPEAQATPPLAAEAEKRRLFEALTQWFMRLAQAQPLVLILEDLHWADETSLDFLQVFLRRIARCPVLALMTYRREDENSVLTRWLARLDREHLAREIVIKPLERADVEALLRAILHLEQPVRPEFLDPIVELTEGNPFFVEEVLKSLVAAGDIFPAGAHWERKPLLELHIPRTVHEAVQRRVAQLSETARQIVLLAAVAGRRFDFALLQTLTGQEEGALLQVMKELMAAQLVSEEAAGRFVFRHALTQQAIYTSALALERNRLQRLIGETLERRHAADLDVVVGDLAYHFYAAEVWDQALRYAQRAGEKAQQMYAPRAAVEQFSRALDAARHLAVAVPVALYHARGQAYELLGEFEAARIDYEQAGHTARQHGDHIAEWQSLIDLGFLWAARDYARTGEYFQQALALVRPLHNPALLGHTLNRLGNWYLNLERTQDALRHHREALEIFEELNDRHGLAATLDLLGLTHFTGGNLIEASGNFERAIALFRELDDRAGLCSALATYGERVSNYVAELVAMPEATLTQTQREEEEAVQFARDIGWRSGEAYALCALTLALESAGQFARALQTSQAALTIAREIEHRQWTVVAHIALSGVYAEVLAFSRARPLIEEAVILAREVGSLNFIRYSTALLALVCLGQNDLPRAEEGLKSLLGEADPWTALDEAVTGQQPLTMSQRQLWCARAELAGAQNDAALALHLIDQLEALAQRGVPDESRMVLPRLALLRAETLLKLKTASPAQLAEAVADLQTACQIELARGARPMACRIHRVLGQLNRAQNHLAEADQQFALARQLIDELAADIPDHTLRDNFLTQALALFPPTRSISARQAAKRKFGGLTERERQVAAFIAQGKSNREIAEALFVGERTIETHVSNILSKLGFDARTQIAAWAADKGLARND
jgi:DNA-binding CsgD family transcriptional regulator